MQAIYASLPLFGQAKKRVEQALAAWVLFTATDLFCGADGVTSGFEAARHDGNKIVRELMCFPGETTVYTKRGIIPMSEVAVGDYVMTHNSRWKRVVHKQSKMSSTVRVKGLGNSIIECTADHKFYARQLEPVLSTAGGKSRHLRPRLLEPEWVEAQQLVQEPGSTESIKKCGVILFLSWHG